MTGAQKSDDHPCCFTGKLDFVVGIVIILNVAFDFGRLEVDGLKIGDELGISCLHPSSTAQMTCSTSFPTSSHHLLPL